MSVLSDKTGYEPDLIEDDMSLEEELGIDSIKRVEILSAVQAQLGVEAKDVEALSQTKTVGEVVAAMIKELGSVAPVASSVSVSAAPVSAAPMSAAPVGVGSGPSAAEAKSVVMSVLSD